MRKIHIVIIFALFVALHSCNQQTAEELVADSFVEISSPQQAYEYISKLIADKRIVILGEVGHGDGRTFEIKADIVRYLDSIGDYAFLFEGLGFFDAAILQKKLPPLCFDTNYVDVAMSWILWGDAQENSDLISNLRSGTFDYWGIESQPTSCNYRLIPYLKDFLTKEKDMKNDFDWKKLDEINKRLIQFDTLISDTEYFYYDSCMIEMQSMFLEKKRNDTDILAHVIDNAISFSEQSQCGFSSWEGTNKGINIRDEQMAQNVEWYINRNPSKKVVIGTANFHGAKNISQVSYGKEPDTALYEKYTLMAEHLQRSYPDDLYSIAFTSGSGYVGYSHLIDSIAIVPDSTSLEFCMLQSQYDYAYLDFSNHAKIKDMEFHSILLGYHNKKGKWAKLYDGLFYIKEQHKAHAIEK